MTQPKQCRFDNSPTPRNCVHSSDPQQPAGRHAHQDASAQMLKGVDLPDGKATTALPMPQSHHGLHRTGER